MSRAFLALMILVAAAAPGAAQDWPTRNMTLVVPFAAGGGVDISARLQAQAIGDILGVSVIVENIGGAGGMTAGLRVAHAADLVYSYSSLSLTLSGGLARVKEQPDARCDQQKGERDQYRKFKSAAR